MNTKIVCYLTLDLLLFGKYTEYEVFLHTSHLWKHKDNNKYVTKYINYLGYDKFILTSLKKNHQSFQPTCAATTRTAAKQRANISITNQVQRGSRQAKQSKHPWKQFWMLPLLVSTLPGYLLWKLLPAQTYLPPFCLQRSSLPQQQGMVVICFQKRGRIIH